MGLDFSHTEARWSYSGFMSFRIKLAKEIGIANLRDMEGFKDGGISWDDHKTDPIYPLLYHSDCDGDLAPEECKTIAPRLRELVFKWDGNDYDKIKALQLADGMDECAENKERLEFR